MTGWHGLSELVQDAVHHGSAAVEEVHQRVARAPLEVLSRVPPLAPPAGWFAALQAGVIAATYARIREVNAAAGAVIRLCLDVAERSRAGEGSRASRR